MKKKNILLLFLIFFVFTCCFTFWQLVWRGCLWWHCAPSRDFSVLDWEIPAELFPEDAYVKHISPPSEPISPYIEEASQDVWMSNNHAIYIIYHLPIIDEAISDFYSIKKRMYDPDSGTKWQIPDTLNFSSTTADDEYIACGLFFDINRCKAVIRYQEYIIFLNVDITNEMTFAHFEKILFYLDEQISSRLYP